MVSRTTLVPDQYMVVLKQEVVQHTVIESRVSKESYTSTDPLGREFSKDKLPSYISLVNKSWKITDLPPKEIRKAFAGGVNGMLLQLNEKEYQQLLNDDRVDFIEQDRMYALSEITPKIKTPFAPTSDMHDEPVQTETTPIGVLRVGGSTNVSTNSSLMANKAWIFDTGIHPHGELNILDNINLTDDPRTWMGTGMGRMWPVSSGQNKTGLGL